MSATRKALYWTAGALGVVLGANVLIALSDSALPVRFVGWCALWVSIVIWRGLMDKVEAR